MTKLDKLKSIIHTFSAVKADMAALGIKKESLSILTPLYHDLNGFNGFEGALLGFPMGGKQEFELSHWNNIETWKSNYNDDVKNTVFFASDIFGHQYGVLNKALVKLNPEIGELTLHSHDIEDWASKILSDYDYETGWSLAHEWQVNNREIQLGERLLPKIPFAMGGEFEENNLTPIMIGPAMKNYCHLYNQTLHAKQGEKIVIQGWLQYK